MKYNEEEAKRIIKKFNLSEKTLRVWKNRGKIPKKYFEIEAKPTYIDSAKEKKEFKNIVSILKSKLINKNQLAEFIGVSNDRLIYLQNGRGLPYKSELIAIKKEINEVRLELKKIDFKKLRLGIESEVNNFLELHANKLLVWHVILDRDVVNATISAMRFGSQKNFPTDRVDFLEQKVLEFLLVTQI